MSIFRRIFYKNRKYFDDDFDWENYTKDSYHRRLKGDIEANFSAVAARGQLRFDPKDGAVVSEGAPMHPNHQLILEAVGQLAPKSVHEVGCGGGDHIANIATLFPDTVVTGGDRGARQLELALARHPELEGRLGLQDITMPFSSLWPSPDLVYTQAVIMHIHTAVSHLVALANMVQMAQKYVLLVENNQCHNFVRDIQNLIDGGHLPWESVHVYQIDGSGGGKGVLLSRHKLDYPELRSDQQIRDGLPVSARRLKRSDQDSDRAIFGFQKVHKPD